ncbi:MAG: hypothetical protein AAB014_03190, partial [Nitrospirota bacterium]
TRAIIVGLVILVGLSITGGLARGDPTENPNYIPSEGLTASDIPAIPEEPGPNDPSYTGWDTVYSLPLIKVDYDLDNDGKVDFSVVRTVIRMFYYDELSVDLVNEIGNTYYYAKVFPRMDAVYVTNPNGLFYYIDLDEDGKCDIMWEDREEDGLNGNEILYDSPSGMFQVK